MEQKQESIISLLSEKELPLAQNFSYRIILEKSILMSILKSLYNNDELPQPIVYCIVFLFSDISNSETEFYIVTVGLIASVLLDLKKLPDNIAKDWQKKADQSDIILRIPFENDSTSKHYITALELGTSILNNELPITPILTSITHEPWFDYQSNCVTFLTNVQHKIKKPTDEYILSQIICKNMGISRQSIFFKFNTTVQTISQFSGAMDASTLKNAILRLRDFIHQSIQTKDIDRVPANIVVTEVHTFVTELKNKLNHQENQFERSCNTLKSLALLHKKRANFLLLIDTLIQTAIGLVAGATIGFALGGVPGAVIGSALGSVGGFASTKYTLWHKKEYHFKKNFAEALENVSSESETIKTQRNLL